MKTITPKPLSTLSGRLKHALEALNISQAELARRIQVQRQAIQYLCQSGTNKSKFAFDIADALSINIEWLLHGSGPMLQMDMPQNAAIHEQKVPLLDWHDIPSWSPHAQINQSNISWTTTHCHASQSAFAVKLKDNAMHPRFDQNTIIVVDPEVEPTHNCFVLANIQRLHEIVFRQYVNTRSTTQLIAYNEAGYKSLALKADDQILGCLLEARWTWPLTD